MDSVANPVPDPKSNSKTFTLFKFVLPLFPFHVKQDPAKTKFTVERNFFIAKQENKIWLSKKNIKENN